MKQLEEWICDECGDIVDTSNGYVIWQHDEDFLDYDFKIIHQSKCDDNQFPSSNHIKKFLGEDGKTYLLSFLSLGIIKNNLGDKGRPKVKNLDQFIDFFRRVQTPFYEEARIKFGNEDILDRFSDANEVRPYQQDALQSIINND